MANNKLLTSKALPIGAPRMPARRNSATNDNAAASAHTTVDNRETGMPSMLARSLRSADARTATPIRVRLRNSATSTITIGATISATKSFDSKRNGPISSFHGNICGKRCEAAFLPHQRGTKMPSSTRT